MKFLLLITPRRPAPRPLTLERRDVERVVRTTARYLVPAILTFAFFTLVAITIRRFLVGLSEASDLQAVAESIEPPVEPWVEPSVEPSYETPA
jgi:hypothetical protein